MMHVHHRIPGCHYISHMSTWLMSSINMRSFQLDNRNLAPPWPYRSQDSRFFLMVVRHRWSRNPVMVVCHSWSINDQDHDQWHIFVFETPPRVPKLPTLDQLPNHGRTAFLKWLETKNHCMGHNNFRAQTKKFAGTWKCFRAARKFPRAVSKFPRKVNKFPHIHLIFLRKPQCYFWGYNYSAHSLKCFGHNYYIFSGLQLFCALYKFFRAQYIFPCTLISISGIFIQSDSHK